MVVLKRGGSWLYPIYIGADQRAEDQVGRGRSISASGRKKSDCGYRRTTSSITDVQEQVVGQRLERYPQRHRTQRRGQPAGPVVVCVGHQHAIGRHRRHLPGFAAAPASSEPGFEDNEVNRSRRWDLLLPESRDEDGRVTWGRGGALQWLLRRRANAMSQLVALELSR